MCTLWKLLLKWYHNKMHLKNQNWNSENITQWLQISKYHQVNLR